MRVLSEGEIQERLKDLEGWNYEGNFIVKEINTKNWKTTIFLVNAIAGLIKIEPVCLQFF
ncbi:MAG TPA: hypothetical protein EYG91_00465 [Aquifex aeolicus]|nr:hypothetical protein [Aquifex aeolicus]